MELTEAVRELRRQLKDTQQGFAARLGLSIRAVANYEKDRKPDMRSLALLADAAHRNNQPKLAQLFADAVGDELGLTGPREVKVLGWHAATLSVQLTPDRKPDFAALLLILRNPDIFAQELVAWRKIRDRVHARAGVK
jgi:transcriptional regulator with XRE-family HTH domain